MATLPGLVIGGLGAGFGGTLRGVGIGGLGIGGPRIRGLAIGGLGVGGVDVEGGVISPIMFRIERGGRFPGRRVRRLQSDQGPAGRLDDRRGQLRARSRRRADRADQHRQEQPEGDAGPAIFNKNFSK